MTLSTLSLQWNAATYLQPPSARCGHICAVIDKIEVILNLNQIANPQYLKETPVYFPGSLIKLLFQYFIGVWHRACCHSWWHQFPESSSC